MRPNPAFPWPSLKKELTGGGVACGAGKKAMFPASVGQWFGGGLLFQKSFNEKITPSSFESVSNHC